ncbi:MAG: phosphodiester glycosidase family protein [Leptolyngbyaceae cyanobacterium CRU_2_3]|nr:phosphodiester glycosidase family protein [Leptolyngbyaceae cyanobacterium CRU_2_3]
MIDGVIGVLEVHRPSSSIPHTIAGFDKTVISTRTRTRRRRRSRHRRFREAYLPHSYTFGRLRVLVLSPLLVIALHLTLSKQPSIASSSAQSVQPAVLSPSWVSTLAQASMPPQVIQQGGQIILNGRALPAAWSQRQQGVGIADAALMQVFGVDLLNTTDATKQPVTWFSEPLNQSQNQPQNQLLRLPSWLTEQYRYLDITQLAQQHNWQVQINRSTLEISTPAAKITQIRQGRQSWGDRLVLDLDRPTPWQVDEQSGESIITLDAKIDPATLRGFSTQSGTYLDSVKLETKGDRTLIRVVMPTDLRPHVWSLNNPNRLLIDIRADSMADRDILWAPGIHWRQQLAQVGNNQFPIISLEVDSRQPQVSLKPILGNSSTVVGTAPLLSTAQRSQAAAAINGGFFNRNTQLPLGAIRSGNRWVSGPILNRGAIAWNDDGEVAVGHLSLQETVTVSTGQQFPVLSLNSGFVGAGICRYTPDWGTTYASILNNEALVVVRNNQVVEQRRTTSIGQTVPIPPDGYVLVVRNHPDATKALVAGASVQINTVAQPPEFSRYTEVVGAGPLLLKNRQIVLNAAAEGFSEAFIQQSAPRSVIATTPVGNLVLVTIHDRIGGVGPTLAETAKIVQQMGFVHALNLDGGSSTTLYLGGQLLDRPASTAARVHNGIGVFIQP